MSNQKVGNIIMTIGLCMLLAPLVAGGVYFGIYFLSMITWTTELMAICGGVFYMVISAILVFMGLIIYNRRWTKTTRG